MHPATNLIPRPAAHVVKVISALGIAQDRVKEAAEKWAFETNGHKWSNNDGTAGDNYGSFIEGAKWQQEQMEKLKDFDIWKEWKNKNE